MTKSLYLFAALLLCCSRLMSASATGTFSVTMNPAPATAEEAAPIGRMLLAKEYGGDLTGGSVGQMLAVRTATPGSAGYVALENVTATLAGKSGTFLLQHNGIMNRGVPALTVSVVPDSGTGELVGLSGSMTIDVKADGHHYTFEYTLPE